MHINIIYMAAGNSRRFGTNKLLYRIDGKPMYLHGLERLARIVRRHQDWRIFVVTQYAEILEQVQEMGGSICAAAVSERDMPPRQNSAGNLDMKEYSEVNEYSEMIVLSEQMMLLNHKVQSESRVHSEIEGQVNDSTLAGKEVQIYGIDSPHSCDGVSFTIHAGLAAAGQHALGHIPDDMEYAFFTADQPYLTETTISCFLETMERERPELGSMRFGNTPGNPTYFSGKYLPELLALTGDTGGRKILKKYPERVRYVEAADEEELYDIDVPGI